MRPPRRGFTFIELLVILAIIGVLVALLVPVLSNVRASSQNVSCLGNLRQIMLAFHLYARDNNESLPPPSGATLQSWESLLKRYVGSLKETYHCPADGGVFNDIGSSYDWRDTGVSPTTAAGRTLSGVRPRAVMAFDALPEWHGKGKINAVLADGTTQTMGFEDCLRDLDTPLDP